MDTTSEKYLDYLCRTCMHEVAVVSSSLESKTEPERKWQSIFDTISEYGGVIIAELLTSTISQIEVQWNDELPKNICYDCLQQLQSNYRFQQMCTRSDQQMRELVAQRNTKLKMPITDNDYEVKSNLILKQEAVVEASRETIEFACVNNSPNTAQAHVTDPLQNIEAVVEHCTEECSSDFVKTEPCVVETNMEYNDDELPLSMYLGKNEVLKVATVAEQVKSATAQHNCHLCNESFEEPRHLKKHLKQHKKNNQQSDQHVQPKKKFESYRFHCDICDRQFHKPESLHKHRLTHDVNVDDQIANICDVCDKTCSSKRALLSHKKMYHSAETSKKPLKQYPCEFCHKSYNRCESLRVHLRTHTGERPYLCPECGKAFSQAGNLKQHRLRHGGDKSFECPYCPAKFTCPNDVCKHKAIHDQYRNKRHICDVCGASFSKSDDLRRHKMLHSGEKPYKCDYCDMRFIRMEYQRRHMRTHTGEKPYKCKYCERAFAQSNDHMKHLRRHLGENIYRCELCPLAFRLASEMRSHFATHKNEDPETRERNMEALKEEEAKLLLKCAEAKITE